MTGPAGHPPWCTRRELPDHPIHQSRTKQVGTPRRRGGKGEVTMWLAQHDGDPAWL